LALTLMSFWSVEIGLSVVGLALSAYVFAFYLRSAARRTSIGRKVTATVGVLTAQMLVTLALSVHLALRFSADVAVPMLTIVTLEVTGIALLTMAVRE